jgi:hypothetical protein
LEAIIQELGRIDELARQLDGLEAVRRMIPSLLTEAEKVMRTSQRLSATLRRLAVGRSANHGIGQRVASPHQATPASGTGILPVSRDRLSARYGEGCAGAFSINTSGCVDGPWRVGR